MPDTLSNSASTRAAIVVNCYTRLLLLMAPLIIFYLLAAGAGPDTGTLRVVNGVAPMALCMALTFPLYRLAKGVPEALWAPVFWLPLSSAVFFGFGPLVEVYGSDATKDMLAAHALAVGQGELFRANMLCAIGIFSLLFGFRLHLRSRSRVWAAAFGKSGKDLPTISTMGLAIIFVFLGGAMKYLLIKPAAWGDLNLVVPGALSNLTPLVDVGFALLTYLGARGSRNAKLLFLYAWPINLLLTLLSFSKMEIVLAVLLPALGAYLGHQKLRRFLINVGLIVLVFVLSQPVVSYGRQVIIDRTGTIAQAGYVERLDIVRNYVAGNRLPPGYSASGQGWWTRLDFAGPQAYAMNAYDHGQAGSTLNDVWMLFIPRVIWPDKPIVVGPGAAFYSLVTGQSGTSFLALSVYGDLYWQFGWFGVVVGSLAIGWLFAMASWRSIEFMHARRFIMMPLILLALQAALVGMNKYVINGIVAVIPMYAAYILLIYGVSRLLRRRGTT